MVGDVKRLVLAWLITAIAATGAAMGVLALLGTGVTGNSSRVLTPAEVHAALSTTTPRTATTPPLTSPAPAPGKLMRTAGGTVIASCTGDQVTLRSWTPALGYSVDEVEPGPAREAKVEFEPDEGEDIELRITCSAGVPVAGP
jgi:hypothetical protein